MCTITAPRCSDCEKKEGRKEWESAVRRPPPPHVAPVTFLFTTEVGAIVFVGRGGEEEEDEYRGRARYCDVKGSVLLFQICATERREGERRE